MWSSRCPSWAFSATSGSTKWPTSSQYVSSSLNSQHMLAWALARRGGSCAVCVSVLGVHGGPGPLPPRRLWLLLHDAGFLLRGVSEQVRFMVEVKDAWWGRQEAQEVEQGWLVTGRSLVRSPAPPPPSLECGGGVPWARRPHPDCSWPAGCRPAWLTPLLVYVYLHEWVNVHMNGWMWGNIDL